MTFKGFDLTPLIGGLITIITGLLAWVGKKIATAQTSADAQNKAVLAALKLGQITTTIAGRAWDRLAPEIQKAMADGEITAEERAALEAEVKAILAESTEAITSSETLSEIAEALGLPLPGLIARIAAGLIDMFTRAHDAKVTTASAKAFPVAVAEEPEESHGG